MPQMCPRFRCQAASLLMRQADRGEHLRPVILLMSTMGSSEARASSKNDAHCPCPGNVANMRELPARGRSWPKKLVRHSQQHPVRLATLNVGTLTGRSRELADSLRKRCADICCAQETPWKGSKSRELGDKREVELRVLSNYAPQGGCSEEEKACFWEDLEQYVQSLEGEEVLLIGRDFNEHVDSRKDGFESCHDGYGYGVRNDDGLRILEYAVASNLIIANTQYRKRKSHLITYTSGGRQTQIDFWMLCRRGRRLLQDRKPNIQKATWFWNEDVQAATCEKKSKYKLQRRTRQPADRDAYLAKRREAKKAVSWVKSDRYKAVCDMLATREGEPAVSFSKSASSFNVGYGAHQYR
ncbi:hypothetical protein RB195_013404 [Necator americanus]|uniref:Endonuclease/exonuclease/phosphatase domain-containing protein n=1 Tax=Necator americanus TaxID=51031 RepID=A0ABR1DVE5_NECAM